MGEFLDISNSDLHKQGEELCGDRVEVLRTEGRTAVILSDGLGSGVKANILATLTTQIIKTMLKADASLEDVMDTVIGTLPVCKVRGMAYATFSIVDINTASRRFRVLNFENPPVFFFRGGRLMRPELRIEKTRTREIRVFEGQLERGDFLLAISDGVLHAGLGNTMNMGWGWDNIGRYVEEQFFRQHHTSRSLVQCVLAKTENLYAGRIGDDATVCGILARPSNQVMVFTGPPLDQSKDFDYVEQLLHYPGRRVVCGGTTGNIISVYLGEHIETDVSTLREEVPPHRHPPRDRPAHRRHPHHGEILRVHEIG